jgi:hypothetical protein
MSTRLLRRLRLIAACVFVLAGAGLTVARAVSVEDLSSAQLLPSAPPALLGPITESGRKGWDCTPERAAGAKSSRDAELPSDAPTH